MEEGKSLAHFTQLNTGDSGATTEESKTEAVPTKGGGGSVGGGVGRLDALDEEDAPYRLVAYRSFYDKHVSTPSKLHYSARPSVSLAAVAAGASSSCILNSGTPRNLVGSQHHPSALQLRPPPVTSLSPDNGGGGTATVNSSLGSQHSEQLQQQATSSTATCSNQQATPEVVRVFPPTTISSSTPGSQHLSSGREDEDEDSDSDSMTEDEILPKSFLSTGDILEFKEPIALGICCMKKKLKQPTMQALIHNFLDSGIFKVIEFSHSLILGEAPECWPRVDCMICFYSHGFPLEKAIKYAQLHPHTFYLTQPASQMVLKDRRSFYEALVRNNIPTARHVFYNRDGYRDLPNSTLEEHEDYIIVDNVRMDKPFVEKPVDADDHDVYVYYHSGQGGGGKRLFRKVDNRSSEELPPGPCQVRAGKPEYSNCSYLYEEFIQKENPVDLKCYTIGPSHVHAEMRKSPVVDGVVVRNENGKELRYDVELTPAELMVARKITKVFRQMVCGFDILRTDAEGVFYVCDVNGWSFVKQNPDYIEKASRVMTEIFKREMKKRGLHRAIHSHHGRGERELCGIVGVFRHADRTPKQKVKLVMKEPRILEFAFRNQPHITEEVIWKTGHKGLPVFEELVAKILKEDDINKRFDEDQVASLRLMYSVLSRKDCEGLKVQIKPRDWAVEGHCVEAVVVCKWGGWLTEAGWQQSSNLGQHFVRRLFFQQDEVDSEVYTKSVSCQVNNERRVMHTALSFCRALLRKPEFSERDVVVNEPLLGSTYEAKEVLQEAANTVYEIMHRDYVSEEMLELPGMSQIINNPVLRQPERTPLAVLHKVRELLEQTCRHIPEKAVLYREEPILLMRQRWVNLTKAFYNEKKKRFDVSKVPDIFDYVSYDACYNQPHLAPCDLYPLFTIAESLSSFVSLMETGLSKQERFVSGSLIVAPLLQSIFDDLTKNRFRAETPWMQKGGGRSFSPVASTTSLTGTPTSSTTAPAEAPKVHLYFTSESHITALRNVLYNNKLTNFLAIDEHVELHFLSHFVFKLYRYRDSAHHQFSHSFSNEHASGVSGSHNNNNNSSNNSGASQFNGGGEGEGGGRSSGDHHLNNNNNNNCKQHLSVAGEGTSNNHGHTSSPSSSSASAPRYQVEVHFSAGVDSNMFGIVDDHHTSCAAVAPMIRVHNNLGLGSLQSIVEASTEERMRSTSGGKVRKEVMTPVVHGTPATHSY